MSNLELGTEFHHQSSALAQSSEGSAINRLFNLKEPEGKLFLGGSGGLLLGAFTHINWLARLGGFAMGAGIGLDIAKALLNRPKPH